MVPFEAKAYADAMVAAANVYMSTGWCVVPIQPRTKKPYQWFLPTDVSTGHRSWRLLTQRPPTSEEVASWFARDRTMNLGIATGAVSRGLAVADFDFGLSEGALSVLTALGTPVASTGRAPNAVHVYAQGDPGLKTRRSEVAGLAFELRCEGAYVVAPYSRHPTGAVYEWLVPPDGVLVTLHDLEQALESIAATRIPRSPCVDADLVLNPPPRHI
jgi:Bifunctional DNA primase/polymerase, N-terminal